MRIFECNFAFSRVCWWFDGVLCGCVNFWSVFYECGGWGRGYGEWVVCKHRPVVLDGIICISWGRGERVSVFLPPLPTLTDDDDDDMNPGEGGGWWLLWWWWWWARE